MTDELPPRARASEFNVQHVPEPPTPLPPYTLDDARDTLEHMRAQHPECDACQTKSYATLFDENPGSLQNGLSTHLRDGWEHLTERAGIIKRCPACAISQLFPWAEKLTPEQVFEWVNRKRAENTHPWIAFSLADMKELVEP